MPAKKGAKFTRHRQESPKEFERESFRTVPLSHTGYRGKKYDPDADRAVVGVFKGKGAKKGPRGGKDWRIQTILRRKDPAERARIKAEKVAKRARGDAEKKARQARKESEKRRKAEMKAKEAQRKAEERARLAEARARKKATEAEQKAKRKAEKEAKKRK